MKKIYWDWIKMSKIFKVIVFCMAMFQVMPADASNKTATASGFSFEITNNEGVVTTIVEGSSADFRNDGSIRLLDVNVQMKDKNGAVIKTPAAFYNRAQGIINSYEVVSIDSETMNLRGIGAKWFEETGDIYVKKNVDIDLINKEGNPIKVKCSGYMKVEKDKAFLHDNVLIDSAGTQINGDKAVILFAEGDDGGFGSIKQMDVAGENLSIVAEGVDIKGKEGQFVFADQPDEKGDRGIDQMTIDEDVVIMFEDKVATGQRAHYTAADDLLVLSGSPQIKEGDSIYAAERIKIYPKQDIVEFEPQAQLIVEG